MKLILSLVLFTLITYAVKGQSTRVYLDNNFNPVKDSTRAASKVILTKYADDTTLWTASQFTMDDKLVVEGVYTDHNMTTPNGPFKYYYNEDTIHYLKATGGFFNGAKIGEWIEYYPDGKKMTVTTFRNNILNGSYQAYNRYDSIPVIKGQYLNGKRNGEWTYPSIKDIYEDGVQVATVPNQDFENKQASLRKAADKLKKGENFQDAVEPYAFSDYMRVQLRFYVASLPPSNAIRNIKIEFIVNEDGRLSKGRIVGSEGKDFQAKIAKAIDTAPQWTPARLNGRPVLQRITYTFIEDKGEISKAQF